MENECWLNGVRNLKGQGVVGCAFSYFLVLVGSSLS